MKQKKLIIFMPSIEEGGVEKNFFLITNYLSKKFKDVSVITTDKSIKRKLEKKISILGPNAKFWKSGSRYLKYIVCLYYLLIFIILNKKVLIFSFQANAYASIIAKLFGKTIITRSNSSSEGWSKNPIKTFLYKILLKLPDKVVVNSKQFKKELDEKFNIKSYVIYNPLNISTILELSKSKIKFNFYKKNCLKLISIGRLVNQKDQLTLLKAINILNINEARLLIIGNGTNEKMLKNYINENKLKSKIKIIPFKKNPYKYLKLADVFLLSSKFEGLPNVVLEAQTLKKYIISTDCPTGPKEILMNGKAGDLVKIGDFKAIAKKIKFYTKNKKKLKIKTEIGFKELKRFNYDYNMSRYFNLIKEFIYFK